MSDLWQFTWNFEGMEKKSSLWRPPPSRISIKEIKIHPWFLKNLPRELTEAAQAIYYRKENPTFSLQSVAEITKIVEEAKIPPPVSRSYRYKMYRSRKDPSRVLRLV
ncbi:hypothetical protein ACFE04_023233 [Oxalis oulophora]